MKHYYITTTTWEDVQDAKENLDNYFMDCDPQIDDFLYEIDEFCKNDFEGLYESDTFYEDIYFESFIDDYIEQFENIINKCNEAIEKLKKYKKDYQEHKRK